MLFQQAQFQSKAGLATANIFNVQLYGADPTGVFDSSVAIQAAIDDAQLASLSSNVPAAGVSAAQVVYIPAGVYLRSKPLLVSQAPIFIVGDGIIQSNILTFNNGTALTFTPGLVVSAPNGTLPLVPSLVSGLGNAWNIFDTTHYLQLDASGAGRNLNGLSSFCCEFFLNSKANQAATTNSIISSLGTVNYGLPSNQAFTLTIGGPGSGAQNCAQATSTINGSVVTLQSAANVVLNNTVQHWALTYDGSTLRLFVAGTLVASSAVSGTITQSVFENIILGPQLGGFPAGTQGTLIGPSNAYVDSIRISHVSRYTSNFSPPTTKLTADNSTALLLNFETDSTGRYSQNYWIRGLAGIPGSTPPLPAWFYPIFTGFPTLLANMRVSDLAIDGIITQGCTNALFENLKLNPRGGACLQHINNGFLSIMRNIQTNASTVNGYAGIVSTFGPNLIQGHYHNGTGAALAGWGFRADSGFYNSTAAIVLMQQSVDAIDGPSANLYDIGVTDEGANSNIASLYAGNVRANFVNCSFEKSGTTTSPCQLSGTTNALIFEKCMFNAKTGTTAIFAQNGASAPYTVIANQPYRNPSAGNPAVPLSADANIVIKGYQLV